MVLQDMALDDYSFNSVVNDPVFGTAAFDQFRQDLVASVGELLRRPVVLSVPVSATEEDGRTSDKVVGVQREQDQQEQEERGHKEDGHLEAPMSENRVADFVQRWCKKRIECSPRKSTTNRRKRPSAQQ